MLILAIDTALDACSAALFDSDANRVVAVETEVIGKGHAERLMAMISAVMTKASVDFNAIDKIGVTVGPGSFTGIRVGLATARGLALAAGKPVVGVSTLEAIAREASTDKPFMVALDARRGELYTRLYDGNHSAISDPQLLTIAEATTALTAALKPQVFGSGAPLLAEAQPSATIQVLGLTAYPDIENVARITAVTAAQSEPPKPLYLRAPDAKPQTRGVVERRGD